MLFDTNIIIDILVGIPAARDRYDICPDRSISVITWMEVMAGTKSGDDIAVRNLLATFIQFPLNPAIVHMAVDVRRTTRLKLPDAIILATARVEEKVLLTRNTRDFQADEGKIVIPYHL